MLYDRGSALFFLCILCIVEHFAGGVRVKVKDETGRVFKSPSLSLPSRLSVEVPDLEGDHVTLALHRNTDQEGTVPVYELTTNNQGQVELIQIPTQSTLTLYQDPANMATFGVFTNHKTGIAEKLKGIIHRDSKVYELTSSDNITQSDDVGVAFDMKVHHQLHNRTGYGHNDVIRDKVTSHVASFIRGDHSRKARAVTQDVYVDVVAISDYAVYLRWYKASTKTTPTDKKQDALDNIYQYYAFVFSGVNMMYRNIYFALSYTIHVTLSSVVVSTNAQEAPWTEHHRVLESGEYAVPSSDALSALKEWAAVTHTLLPFDHLMLFTGYDLTGNGSTSKERHTNAGLAYEGTLCSSTDGRATSIIEDLGGLQCMDTATHELGHSLGSDHDGENNLCNSDDGYIMSTGDFTVTQANKLHRWHFSSCSITLINNFITDTVTTVDGRTCLYNKVNTHLHVVDVTLKVAGQVYPIDEQCRQVYGPKSYFCRGVNDTGIHWDDVCNMVYCYKPTEDLCEGSSSGAAEGTTCGSKRWCDRGECAYAVAAPSVPDNCPFGDKPGLDEDGMTCAEVAQQTPNVCHTHYGATVCCSSCAKVLHPGVGTTVSTGGTGVAGGGTCPDAWTSYHTSCYIVLQDAQNWYNSKTRCEAVGGHLVEIENSDENHFVAVTLLQGRLGWIGLEDFLIEGEFAWATSGQRPSYTHWLAGEPNSDGNEDCVEINLTVREAWNDKSCDVLRPPVCERQKTQTLVGK